MARELIDAHPFLEIIPSETPLILLRLSPLKSLPTMSDQSLRFRFGLSLDEVNLHFSRKVNGSGQTLLPSFFAIQESTTSPTSVASDQNHQNRHHHHGTPLSQSPSQSQSSSSSSSSGEPPLKRRRKGDGAGKEGDSGDEERVRVLGTPPLSITPSSPLWVALDELAREVGKDKFSHITLCK